MVIKALNTQNPFSDYGQLIKGKRFAGRKPEVQTIRNRVIGESFGNIAVMGMPRIGKSSLVWNALIAIKDEQIIKGNIIITIYVGEISTSIDFFKSLVHKVVAELEFISNNKSQNIDKLITIYHELRIAQERFDFDNLIDKFFKFLNKFGYRATFILDEFDNISRFFTVADFQRLRKLASQEEWKICLVTVSRRTIQEIEPENGAISNFYGIFSDLRLGLFSKEDILEYWDIVKSFEIEISEDFKRQVKYLVGHHPFLVDLYNYEAFNLAASQKEVSSDSLSLKMESELKLNLYDNFEKVLKLMKEEGLYSKAIQLILGPVYDVTPIDEQKLLKYQFIRLIDNTEKIKILKHDLGIKKDNSNHSYVCFSDYFTELINLKFSDIDYWPLWNQTEKNVREIIKEYISEIFGDNWELSYLKKHEKSEGKLKGIQKLDEVRSYTKNKFGSLASSNLIDYTFPRDMYDLFISSDWPWFEKVFGESKSEWGKRFNTLAEIRNPIAHNNSEFISPEDLKNAKKYCEIIINRITQWRINK
jgi:hypothetical protein